MLHQKCINIYCMIYSIYFVELAPEFVRPLTDQSIIEGQTATFECELNIDGATVKWFHEGFEVNEDDRYQVLVKGRVHKLVVKDAVMPDAGEVIAKVEDKSTHAFLTVMGEPLHFL